MTTPEQDKARLVAFLESTVARARAQGIVVTGLMVRKGDLHGTTMDGSLDEYKKFAAQLPTPEGDRSMREHNGSMSTPALQAVEDRSAAVAKGPRVTLADINAAIDSVHYKLGVELLTKPVENTTAFKSLAAMTVCMIVLKNGFVFIGEAAPADPANYNKTVGEQNAYEAAVKKIWPAMGFALRDHLHKREQFDSGPKSGEAVRGQDADTNR